MRLIRLYPTRPRKDRRRVIGRTPGYEIASCPTCNETGFVECEGKATECPECKGYRFVAERKEGVILCTDP